MRIRKVDSNGDIVFGQPDDYLVNSKESVALLLKFRLNLWLGTWFANTQSGVPYLQEALGKKKVHVVNAFIQETIRQTTGVLEILDYFSYLDQNGKFNIKGNVRTIYGEQAIDESDIIPVPSIS